MATHSYVYTTQSGDTLNSIKAMFGSQGAMVVGVDYSPNLLLSGGGFAPGTSITVHYVATDYSSDEVDGAPRIPIGGGVPDLYTPNGTPTGPSSPSSPSPPNTSYLSNPTEGVRTTATSVDERMAQGGWVTFNLLTEQGPAEVPVFFQASVWQALAATPMFAQYGLNLPEPSIQIGLSENFKTDANKYLTGATKSAFGQAVTSLDFFDEVSVNGGDLPMLSPEMMATGIMWAQDPISGEMELIDTQPLYGPSLSAFRFTPTDPNNPSAGGQWQIIADLALEKRSMFEGVPTSVEPWLQLALDSGGDYNVVPEGPARSWVKYLLDQTVRSSSRAPSEQPFGIGLPNFPGGTVGSVVPDRPAAWDGKAGMPPTTNMPPTTKKPTGQPYMEANPRPDSITQTQIPGYYDIPADPTQPVSGNPLQEQNGWILGADGRWRAKNPLTGVSPNNTPWEPYSYYDAKGNPVSKEEWVPPETHYEPPPMTPAPTASPTVGTVTQTPVTKPAPAPTTAPALPNGWTYDAASGMYKGPNPFAK